MIIEGHEPNPELRYIITFSGGKDSVATWLYLTRELLLPKVECIFSDTGHEADQTYEYIGLLEREHGLPIERIQPTIEDFRGEMGEAKIRERLGVPEGVDVWQEPLTMERLSILKRRFPSTMARFCTEHLKLIPMRNWVKTRVEDFDSAVMVTGVRAQESIARAGRVTWSRDDLTGLMLWMPIHKWTHEEVFALARKHGVPPNPLYLNGMSRVGCWPCIMARKNELAQLAMRYPESYDRLLKMEQRVAEAVGKPAVSFFSNDKTPERFHSETCQASGKTFPTAEDVRRWAMGEISQMDSQLPILFEDDWTEDASSCLSRYGLCE